MKNEKGVPKGIVGRFRPSFSGRLVAPPSWTRGEVTYVGELQEVKRQGLS